MGEAVHVRIQGKRIRVDFPYSAAAVHKVKGIAGRIFVGKDKGGPYWTVPLDMDTCRHLRTQFGRDLVIEEDLLSWAKEAVRTETTLGAIAGATDATLLRLPTENAMLAEMLKTYQRVGSRFVAAAPATLLADQPGLGKTFELIGGLFEAGTASTGPTLVVAPLTALETVWEHHLTWLQPYGVYVATGTKAQREAVLAAFAAATGPRWLVINYAMVQWRKDATNHGPHIILAKQKDWYLACKCERNKKPHWHYQDAFPILAKTEWANIVLDECHNGAIRDPKTITAKALYSLRLQEGGKRVGVTGTPMKNKPKDLWGILHWLRPDVFTSLWSWAERWCEIEDNGFGKKIGAIREDCKEEFFRSLTPYVLRRTKHDVAPELPPKRFVDVWCHMTPAQEKQYASMEKDGLARIADVEISATSILAEFTRLKQFAIGACDLRDGKIIPTEDGGKMEHLLSILEERGIFDERLAPEDQEKVVIFSQFSEVVDLVEEVLMARGVEVAKITGEVKGKKRTDLQRAFQQDGGPRVFCITTTAGGVAITLDRADTVIFTDEMWSPADMEQAEDRVHRVSRIHNVTIYTLRTRGTIDEYVMETADDKEAMATEILDIRRKVLADKGMAA